MRPIYLDSHATTPMDERVRNAMEPYINGKFGNASSMDHAYGQEASEAVESAKTAGRIVHPRQTKRDHIYLRGNRI